MTETTTTGACCPRMFVDNRRPSEKRLAFSGAFSSVSWPGGDA